MRFPILVAFCAGALLSCKTRSFNPDTTSATKDFPKALIPNTNDIDMLRYIYNGPLPSLENIEINGSMKGLTVRVTGTLPSNWIQQQKAAGKTWQEALPFYALIDSESPPRISVVYPIASTAPALHSLKNPSLFVGQDQGGTYSRIEVNPWRTDGGSGYGGFPFIHYTMDTMAGISFHGPINVNSKYWYLQRGYVSHGCKRMQAEHVVEMAHLLGVNMKKIYKRLDNSSSWPTVKVNMRMQGMKEGYDRYKGKLLDVTYPIYYTTDEWVKKGVAQPVRAKEFNAANTFVAPTWDARDFPSFVCAAKGDLKVGQTVGDDYCKETYFAADFQEADIKVDPRPQEDKCFDIQTIEGVEQRVEVRCEGWVSDH